jgi:hypothetical protein
MLNMTISEIKEFYKKSFPKRFPKGMTREEYEEEFHDNRIYPTKRKPDYEIPR